MLKHADISGMPGGNSFNQAKRLRGLKHELIRTLVQGTLQPPRTSFWTKLGVDINCSPTGRLWHFITAGGTRVG